ncbi:unnamed protein product [Owenia fusiformis]|uniref:Uncharacterized protein n=1 Tax=Owenia fusiformis TaxID=6347 RepID=A0A8S4PLR3_OWEFU|nr:unnamed protein product [Owenia fusiformis]
MSNVASKSVSISTSSSTLNEVDDDESKNTFNLRHPNIYFHVSVSFSNNNIFPFCFIELFRLGRSVKKMLRIICCNDICVSKWKIKHIILYIDELGINVPFGPNVYPYIRPAPGE